MFIKVTLVLVVCVCLVYGYNTGSACGPGTLCLRRRSVQEFSISDGNRDIRSIQEGSYQSVKLQDDPCSFKTYDINHDGNISQDELYVILGTDKVTEAVFNEFDTIKDDGVITPEEFDAKVENIIFECI